MSIASCLDELKEMQHIEKFNVEWSDLTRLRALADPAAEEDTSSITLRHKACNGCVMFYRNDIDFPLSTYNCVGCGDATLYYEMHQKTLSAIREIFLVEYKDDCENVPKLVTIREAGQCYTAVREQTLTELRESRFKILQGIRSRFK